MYYRSVQPDRGSGFFLQNSFFFLEKHFFPYIVVPQVIAQSFIKYSEWKG